MSKIYYRLIDVGYDYAKYHNEGQYQIEDNSCGYWALMGIADGNGGIKKTATFNDYNDALKRYNERIKESLPPKLQKKILKSNKLKIYNWLFGYY